MSTPHSFGGIVTSIDDSAIRHLAEKFRRAGNQAPHAIRRALNHTGDKTRTQVIRALTAQTGLKRKVIASAVKTKRANYGALEYRLRSKGGNVRLKFFGARETRKGVSAAPWNARRVYSGAFMKGGRFPKRVVFSKRGMGGNVFRRAGRGRLPIEQVRSGLFIPNEMINGQSAAAFLATVKALLPARVAHELDALLSGAAPRG